MISTITSKAMNKVVEFRTVEPEVIDKVLIFLHGFDSHYEKMDKAMPLQMYADKYNMLIVTPNMDNGYYIDRDNHKVSEFISDELINHIKELYDANYCDFYIGGISMGGFGALLIGANNPKEFKGIISISGAYFINDILIGNELFVGMSENSEKRKFVRSVFAPVDILENNPKCNPYAAIKLTGAPNLPPIVLTIGDEDIYYDGNKRIDKLLNSEGAKHTFLVLGGMDHEEICFRDGLRDALESFFG